MARRFGSIPYGELWPDTSPGATWPTGNSTGGSSGPTVADTIVGLKGTTGVQDGAGRMVLGHQQPDDGGGAALLERDTSLSFFDEGRTFDMSGAAAGEPGGWIRRRLDYSSGMNVAFFGASGANSARDTTAFQRACAEADDANMKVHVPPPSFGDAYLLEDTINLHRSDMEGQHQAVTLRWPGDLGSGKYMIEMTGPSSNFWESPKLRNLRLDGPGSGVTYGTSPANMDGVRCGSPTYTQTKPALQNVTIEGVRYAMNWDSASGHIAIWSVECRSNYAALYIARGNGDYSAWMCAFAANAYAGIVVPNNSNFQNFTWVRSHIGYQPYAIVKIPYEDPTPGERGGTSFVANGTFLGTNFENCGNAAIKDFTTNTTEPYGTKGVRFVGCQLTMDPTRRYTAESADWAVDCGYIRYVDIDWGVAAWDPGALGVIRSRNTGTPASITIRGKGDSYAGGEVLFSGNSNDNRWEGQDANAPKTVSVPAGATSATYTLSQMEQMMRGAINPTATPRSNPGSAYWCSKNPTNGNVTVNLAAPAPTGGVVFNLQLL